MIEIKRLKKASAADLEVVNLLLKQLRIDAGAADATMDELQEIVSDKNVALVAIRDDNKLIGMATLYMITKFGKRVAFVEDVVVDEAYRGQGLGEKLMRAVIAIAREERVGTLNLTSRPERVAANKLYQKVGFELKNTNVYRLKL